MVIKKSFTLLVATKTIPFFVSVPIISDHRCSYQKTLAEYTRRLELIEKELTKQKIPYMIWRKKDNHFDQKRKLKS